METAYFTAKGQSGNYKGWFVFRPDGKAASPTCWPRKADAEAALAYLLLDMAELTRVKEAIAARDAAARALRLETRLFHAARRAARASDAARQLSLF